MTLHAKWPQVFTCPAGSDEDVARDDLGYSIINPTFSNRQKMVEDPCDGCEGCDMKDECEGPVEYTLKN